MPGAFPGILSKGRNKNVFDKSHMMQIVNFLMNIFIGITLNVVGNILSGHPIVPFLSFMQSMVVSIGIGFTIGELLPAIPWGHAIAAKLHVTDGLPHHILATAISAIFLIGCISLCIVFSQAGSAIFVVWPMLFPAFYVAGAIVMIFTIPLSIKIAEALTR